MSLKTFSVDQLKNLFSKFKTRVGFDEATSDTKGLMSAEDKYALDSGVLKALREASGAGLHNCIYRGKNLGSVYTDEQKNAIGNGTFDDLYVGDYWHFDNVEYDWEDDDGSMKTSTWSGDMRIAAFDYYLRTGTPNHAYVYTHHIIVVPDNPLFSRAMNASKTTEGAYVGSDMRNKPSGILRAKALFLKAFGANTLLKHTQYFFNTVIDGKECGGADIVSEGVELMSETQLYGKCVYRSCGYNPWQSLKQFNLFQDNIALITNMSTFWLQDVVSTTDFSLTSHYGSATYNPATSHLHGVRPYFVLIKPA